MTVLKTSRRVFGAGLVGLLLTTIGDATRVRLRAFGWGRSAPESSNRHKLLLSFTKLDGYGNSRLFTNLLCGHKQGRAGAAGGDGKGPYLATHSHMMDVTVYNPDTGGHIKTPPGTTAIYVRANRPFPKGAEAGKWLAIYFARSEITASFQYLINVSSKIICLAKSPVLGRTSGCFYFGYHLWDATPETSFWGVTYSGIPDSSVDGGADTQVWGAEIRNNTTGNGFDSTINPAAAPSEWSWYQDPAVDRIWFPTLDDRAFFGIFRHLDTLVTNRQSMFVPLTAANRPRPASALPDPNGFIVDTPFQTIPVSGGTIGFGIGGAPRYQNAAGDFFDVLKTTDAPWRPIGNSLNDMSVQGLAPAAGPNAVFTWDGINHLLTITPAIISGVTQTWTQVIADWNKWYNATSPYTASAGASTVNQFVTSIGASAATAFARTYFTGGRTSQRPGSICEEDLVTIHNYHKTDMWVTIPGGADESWLRVFFGYINDHAWAGMTLYVEDANEPWNSAFIRNAELAAYGSYLSGNNDYHLGKRKSHIDRMTIIQSELTNRGQRVTFVRVDNANQGEGGNGSLVNNSSSSVTYGPQWKAAVDAHASAPYIVSSLNYMQNTGAGQCSPWAAGAVYNFNGQFITAVKPGGTLPSLWIVNVGAPPTATAAVGQEPGSAGASTLGTGSYGTGQPLYILAYDADAGVAYTEAYRPWLLGRNGSPFGIDAPGRMVAQFASTKTACNTLGQRLLQYEGTWDDAPSAAIPLILSYYTALTQSQLVADAYAHLIVATDAIGGSDTTIAMFGDDNIPHPSNHYDYQNYAGCPDAQAVKRPVLKAYSAGTLVDPTELLPVSWTPR